MSKGFNLSKKKIKRNFSDSYVYDENDVKEFIRLLKETINKQMLELVDINANFVNNPEYLRLYMLLKEIDKLAGSELVGKELK